MKNRLIPFLLSTCLALESLSFSKESLSNDLSTPSDSEAQIINYEPLTPPPPPGKFALIISVENYQNLPPVENALNDGLAVSEALKKAGFEYIRFLPDPIDTNTIIDAIDEFVSFSRASTEPAILTIYYAGHGFFRTESNNNYLVPARANKNSLVSDSLPIPSILTKISPSSLSLGIVFLDACRTIHDWESSPESNLKVSDQINSGFGNQKEDRKTVISFATSPNSPAASVGRYNRTNSPYSGSLAKYIPLESVSLDNILDSVRADVKIETNERQIPTEIKRAGTSRFYFNPGKMELENQDKILNDILSSGPKQACLQKFIEEYPANRHIRKVYYLLELAKKNKFPLEQCGVNYR